MAPKPTFGSLPFSHVFAEGLSPLILTCEHASNRLPPGTANDAPSRQLLRTHWAYDVGAWALTRATARTLRCSAIGGRWSRLIIDLNRHVGDSTAIRATANGVRLVFNQGITIEEVERRSLQIHAPYHSEIDRLISRRILRGIRPLLFSIHSFTPTLGRSRRDFDAGVLYDEYGALARKLASSLRAEGASVRMNQPYSGKKGLIYSVQRHSVHHAVPCLELEINQRALSDPDGIDLWRKRLAKVLPPLIPTPAP